MFSRISTLGFLLGFPLATAVSLGLACEISASERHAQIYLDNLGEPEEPEGDPGIGAEDQLPRPDVKDGIGEGEPPHSAHDRKQDKLGPELGDAPARPVDRPKLLAELYERLAAARDAETAKPIMAAIEEVWRVSDSDTIDLLVGRAERLIGKGELDLALKILNAAADIGPETAELWYQRARVYALMQKRDQAFADLKRALKIDPKHYHALNDLGRIQEEAGAKTEALEAYRKALEVNPFLDEARRAADGLSRETGSRDI